jgi:hypothetical protein
VHEPRIRGHVPQTLFPNSLAIRVLLEVLKSAIQNAPQGPHAACTVLCARLHALRFERPPIEDRGFRPSHTPSGQPFGAAPIEDRGFGPCHDPSAKPFGATPMEDPGL